MTATAQPTFRFGAKRTATFYALKSADNALLVTQWGFTSDSPIATYDTH